MKIHAFKVTPRGSLPLDAVLGRINALPLADRLRTISGAQMRLEAGNRAAETWALDFAGIRPEGPGRASPTLPIADFDLTDDEGFGEETAAIYDVATGIMALQFNSRGPRSGRIQSYLFRFARLMSGLAEDAPADDDHGFTLAPVIKHDSVERLNRATVIRRFRVSVHVPGLAAPELAAAPRGRSLASILANPIVGHAANLNLEISAGRRRRATLDLAAIRDMVQEAFGLGDEVRALEAVIREDEDSPNEPIDLLQARLEADVRVERTGRRYARNDRWAALRETLAGWAADGRLA